jgi:glutathione S-transferase
MKLYYCPGACSLSAHIVAREAGIELKLEKVDLQTKKSGDSGTDFTEINRKSYVPALQLDDGAVLTEVPAVVQYLAEKKPHSGLAPAAGTLDRHRLQEMLGFINSEFHRTYSDLFNPAMETVREVKLGYLTKRYAFIEQHLAGRSDSCRSRRMRTDSPTETSTRFFAERLLGPC